MDKAYDKFDVEIKNVQLLFARAGNMLLSFQDPKLCQGALVNMRVCACMSNLMTLEHISRWSLKKAKQEPIIANPCHSYKQKFKIWLFFLRYLAPF